MQVFGLLSNTALRASRVTTPAAALTMPPAVTVAVFPLIELSESGTVPWTMSMPIVV